MSTRGPSVQTIIEMEARPAPHKARRNRFLLRSEPKIFFNIARPRSIRPWDQNFDAAVFRPPVRRRVGRNGRFRAFAVHLDAIRTLQALLQELADRFRALDRKMPVGREADALDRLIVGMSDHLAEP